MLFLFPQKPRHIHNVSVAPKNYFIQIKKNGWRAEIQSEDNSFIINSREGTKLSRCNSDHWKFLETIFPKPFYLDGELIGTRQANKKLNHIVIWDIPILGGKDLTKLDYIDRYNELLKYANVKSIHLDVNDVEKFGTMDITENDDYKLLLSMNFEQKEYKNLWDIVVKEEIKNRPSLPVNEGLVLKNPNARDLWNLYSTKERISQLKLKTREM
jgi:hypothetical protein